MQNTASPAYTLAPDKLAAAVAYAHARHLLYFTSTLLVLLALFLLVRFGLGQRVRARLPYFPAILAIMAIASLLELPSEMYGHVLSVRYGISLEAWPAWFRDWALAELIAIGTGAVLAAGFYWLVRWSPRRWWILAWLATLPMGIFTAFLEPYLVEPLFDTFEPLSKTRPALVGPLEQVIARSGIAIPPDRLFEMKASAKTRALNAYVSGFGSSRRVVLYDTIIEKESQPQLLTTFGHELGHYALNHIPKGLFYGSLLSLMLFFVGYRFLRTRTDLGNPASLPLLLLLLGLSDFFKEPLVNAYSRAQEHEADVYSLQVTNGVVPNAPEAAAAAFQIEGETDLEEPDPAPFIKFWLYSHPPIADRLRFARSWRPT